MFPLRRRTTVVGERGHRLARRHVRVLVLSAVPGAAVVGGGVARAVVTGPGVVTVAVSRTFVARIAIPGTVIARLVVPGTVVASLVIAGPVVAGLVVAGRRARVIAAVGVPAGIGTGTLVATLVVATLLVATLVVATLVVATLLVATLVVATLLMARRVTATALVARVVVTCVTRFGVRRARAGVALVPVVLALVPVLVASGLAGVLLVARLAVPALGVARLAVLAVITPVRLEGLAPAHALVVPVALISLLGVRLSLVSLLLVAAVVITLAGVGSAVVVLAGVGRPERGEPGRSGLAVRGRGIRPVAAIGPGARLLAIPVSLVTRLGRSRVPAVLVPLARLRRLGPLASVGSLTSVGSLGSVSVLVGLVGVGPVGVLGLRGVYRLIRVLGLVLIPALVRVLSLLGVPLIPVLRRLGVLSGVGVARLVAVASAGRQRPRNGGDAECRRSGRVIGAQGAEITGHRAGEISLTANFAHASITGHRGEPRVGRGTGKLARETAGAAGIGIHAALQSVDQPGQFFLGQPERTGAGTSLPDTEHRDPGIGVPTQAHAAGTAAHVEENLTEPGQRSCVPR